jgi:hypothetical protein
VPAVPALPAEWPPAADQDDWIRDFVRRHGRRPRVLHIGNIANNAYNNAKLMYKAGLDCDVICYDYYHIMGCPEWEDADFAGDVEDQFNPDWTRMDLRGFERPAWFAQGPMLLCIDYLIARRTGDAVRTARLWRRLQQINKTRRHRGKFEGVGDAWAVVVGVVDRYVRAALTPETVERKVKDWRRAIDRRLERLRRGMEPAVRESGGILTRARRWTREMLVRGLALPVSALFGMLRVVLVGLSKFGLRRVTESLVDEKQQAALARHVRELQGSYAAAFPERDDALRDDDLTTYLFHLPIWQRLFGHYDVIQGYATAPLLPMLAGYPYFAFEHGTLREIPFRRDAMGRLTSLAYHRAAHAFVTNADCLGNARRLCGDRHTFINHPYDEDHGLGVTGGEAYRASLRSELDAEFLFFFPTRHDWVADTGYADKANDVFLRAFARLRRAGVRVGMVTCRWGRNVDESRELLRRAECDRNVKWVEPMGIVRFERTAKASDIVVDQFKLGAFGGVTFKSLAAGVPVCTYLSREALGGLFPTLPPVVNCRTEDEIVNEMTRLACEPARLTSLGVASRQWIKAYHGAEEVVRAQCRAYARRLDSGRDGRPAPTR